MTPIQIASSVIEKLQEENRIALETLHKSQSNIKYLERQLAEKERLIKILEDKLRIGANTFLETSNRQKEITIKHLELQIQKLLKENKELEKQLNIAQFDVCAKCETRYFLGMSAETNPVPKTIAKKPILKNPLSKSAADTERQNREKMLERIIEHKDKRIIHLSKEVQRLSKTEKELTNKVYRLSKLIPLSHMPSEVLTECLLKEIQSLESQIQLYKGGQDKFPYETDTTKFKFDINPSNEYDRRKDLSVKGTSIGNSASNVSLRNVKDTINLGAKKRDTFNREAENIQQENVTLASTLHKLYNDVSELKRLFASENEKLYQSLTSDTLRKDVLKIQWRDIISRLNDIAESIQNIIRVNPNFKSNEIISDESENVILRLQDRLRDSLELATQYENENASLKENIAKLKDQLLQKQNNLQMMENQTKKLSDEINATKAVQSTPQDMEDIQHLKGLLNLKQKQLDSAESHLRTCQNFIDELKRKSPDSDNFKQVVGTIFNKKDIAVNTDYQFGEQSVKSLITKLEVAEKNIKTCEGVIEGLQKVIQNLEEENIKLESDLHMAKFKKVLCEANNNHTACLKSKLKDIEDELTAFNYENKDLKTRIHSLEAENLTLKNNLRSTSKEVEYLKSSGEEKTSLLSKLEVSEKRINTLEENISKAQEVIEIMRKENFELQAEVHSNQRENVVSKAYEDDVMSLRNELILKEDEIRNLKESLHAFEHKAYEMNHYRKTLRQEIEKLCDALLENSESSRIEANRKAIYKAAVLHSAQALLRLDDDFNFIQSEDNEKCNALEEMKRQVSIYLTEVSRIHELLTIKEQEKENLLKQFLNVNNLTDLQGFESSHEMHFQEAAPASGVGSVAGTSSSSSLKATGGSSSESGIHSAEKNLQKGKNQVTTHNCSQSEIALRNAHEELETSKSITTYLLSKCSQLEDLLEKEKIERANHDKEIELQKNTIKDLKSQVNVKNNVAKRLNTLIEMMRSKECNDEITVEQLKSEIKWLVNENQKVFEKITATQSELSRCKEENSRIQNDLESLKRQLINEKYEHAKVNNELKHLRSQISNSQSSTLNDI
ncbi:uncharacterized protein TNCT_106821 [Trichonephila clavata]|uniref:Uncharacterized protein n=1 Tax=Trichonephila clavata TaxID=2740835 RepID=A0A8X6EZ50_TRICU|nr:uncharacterized protein TNCT_106821 [Trichonephila clavata]